MTKKDFNINNIIHHFGLDHLEIYGTFIDETIFEKLDFDNSNYSELDEYKIIKNEVPKFKYKIVFSRDDYSLFAYYKGIPRGDKQPVGTKDYIVVYSTAFKLMEYEEILGFLQWYINLRHCRRFDICIDLKISIDYLLSNYFNDYQTGRDYRKGTKTETRYFGEMKNSLNKRQLIRVYNKNLDILQKKKISLYQDYLLEPNITRIELEIRQELAKVRNYYDVFDNYILIGIFKNYLYKYSKIFDSIEGERITLYKSKYIKLDSEEYQSLYYKNYRKGIFLGHAKTIYNMGFCPVRVLIGEGYIQDKTKYLLGAQNIADLYNKEIELKQKLKDDKYFRDTLEETINNLYKYGKV